MREETQVIKLHQFKALDSSDLTWLCLFSRCSTHTLRHKFVILILVICLSCITTKEVDAGNFKLLFNLVTMILRMRTSRNFETQLPLLFVLVWPQFWFADCLKGKCELQNGGLLER